MKMPSSTHRFHAFTSLRDCGLRLLTGFLIVVAAFASMGPTGAPAASAQAEDLTPGCSPSIFHNARISWTDTERYLASPDAPADVVTSVTDVIEQVYQPNGAMSYAALERLTTQSFREMIGLDCADASTPPAAATPSADASPSSASGASYLVQVRQTDDGVVSAFVVIPDTRFVPDPDATPGSASSTPTTSPAGFNIPPGYTVTDGVVFVVFVQQDGQWMIDYLSDGLVIFSDVVPNDEQLRTSGATFTVEAFDLRESGMPAFPADSTLVASPEASPAG